MAKKPKSTSAHGTGARGEAQFGQGIKIIAHNRKASFLYSLSEKFEAGLVLMGSEVKSLRDGRANLSDSYIDTRRGELHLFNAHISPYPAANRFNHEPLRPRKLLLNHHEIEKITARMRERGFTVVPTKMYFKKGRAKCEIALAKGKKLHDKRESIRRKEQERVISRAVKSR